MQQMKIGNKIPISKCKEVSAEYGYDEVIIVAAHYQSGTQSVATYGRSQEACENAAKGGNAIKKLLNWPEDLCNAKPARQKKREKLDKLERLLKYSDRYEINIQFWPDQTAVYTGKDDVELESYGGDFDFAIDKSIEYLDRINKPIDIPKLNGAIATNLKEV